MSNEWPLSASKRSRGALFHLLRNRIYLGQIVHREQSFDGEHDAIIVPDLFQCAQRMLDGNARRHRAAADHRIVKAPLTGKLFDASGEPMSPTFSRGKSGRAYRYYVSASLQQGAAPADVERIQRISAPTLEKLVNQLLERWLGSGHSSVTLTAIRFGGSGLLVDLPAAHGADIAAQLADGETILYTNRTSVRVQVELALPLRGGKRQICTAGPRKAEADAALITALRKAHRLTRRERGIPLVDVPPHRNTIAWS